MENRIVQFSKFKFSVVSLSQPTNKHYVKIDGQIKKIPSASTAEGNVKVYTKESMEESAYNITDSDYSLMYEMAEIEKSFNTDREYLYPPLIGNENLNGIVDMNRNLVLNQEENKIFPYEVENLEERFNMKRFPDRIRREARVLKKYNTLANYAVVIVYFLFKASLQYSKKSRLAYYAKLAHDLIDVPENSLKAKISQLHRWDEMETNNQLSYGLIDAYYKLANLDPNKLLTIIKSHGLNDAEKELEINKLIKKDK